MLDAAGQALAFAPELFPVAAQGPALFFRRRGHADDTHGPEVAPQVAIQIQRQFAGIGLIGDHPLVLGIEFLRMRDLSRDAEGGELALQMEAAGTGFVNHNHLLGQRELLLDEVQEADWTEPLGGLQRLAIAHPDHPDLFVNSHGARTVSDFHDLQAYCK